jgi:ribosomal protein S18 acetylase RimI-like enzyme
MGDNSGNQQTNGEENIRGLEPRDRSPIGDMVISSGKFNDVEVATALELVDEALKEGEGSGYLFAVLGNDQEHDSAIGYACYGPVPLTDGVYDLYWIVVDPSVQSRGLGRRLLVHAERDVVKRGGRMLLIETSSQESYGATIRFYERGGYHLEARVRDFYKMGDDKLIFKKELKQG